MNNPTRILVVEDEPIVVADLRTRLGLLEYKLVGTAATGAKALTLAEQHQPDLVLMDIRLKGAMDGIEAALEIGRRWRLPVVFLTAYSEDATLERAKLAEPYGYLLKPFEDRELKTTIEMALFKHRAERELQASEERYRSLVNTMKDVIYSVTADGKVSFVSPQVQRYGLTVEEIVGQDFTRFIVEEDRPIVLRDFMRTITTGEDTETTFRFVGNGKVFWAEDAARPLRDSAGRIVGITGMMRDVTDRKLAEEKLRESEERLRGITSAALDAIVMMDDRGRVCFWNQAAETLFGFSAEEALGKEVHKLMVPPAQREAAMSEVAQFLEQAHGKVLGKLLSLTATHRDGRQIPIELSVAPIHLRSRHMAVGIVRDISERKRAEEVLRLKNVLLSSQQEASIDGILVVDENAQILSYNRRFVEMWRVPEELMAELKDEPVLKYVADQTADAEAFLRRVRDLYEHRDETGQDELTLADGRIIDRYSAPLFGAESRYYGRAWYFRDMSERRRLELQLRQAQKLEAVGQLAGGVAHDFNNILTAILLHLNLLQTDQKLAANVQAELKDLETEAQRAVSLTRQLLMFSRREVMRRQVFDLNSLVGTLLKMLCRVIGEHIKLEMSGASESMWIEADAGMVEQIIMNLCVNARDAMPTGGRISLQTQLLEFDATVYQRHAEARPGRFVCLKVSDTGCGMDAETLKRVFEPFFTTKEPGKGTGLGLATVYGIVKQHQGWVEVQSAVGHGTEFSIFLPACEHAPIPEAQPATSAPIPGGNETLLLVEDERSVRATAGRILQQLGYRVLEAGSAPEALQIWAQNQGNVDLLITDVVMPGGLSGLELAEQLLKQRMGLRAILLSGYSAEIAHWGIPNSEQIKFLAKPLSTRLLAQTVRECLDAKSKRAT